MKLKIEVEHEGKIFIGDTELKQSSSEKLNIFPIRKIPNYKKDSTTYYLYRLVSEDKFFDSAAIRTTEEIVNRIKIRFDKKVQPKKGAQQFAHLVKDGYLERERIFSRGKGAYIWFLPTTSKEKVESFIKAGSF